MKIFNLLINSEVMKVIGERWSKLNVDRKKHYVDLAAEEKVRYDQEMIVYHRERAMLNLMLPTENQTSVIEQQESPPILGQL
jgi:hypothetical protein